MNCPKCLAELPNSVIKCTACGFDIEKDADDTAILAAARPDDTPTQIGQPRTSDTTHNTTTGSGQFVSGTVLASRYRIIGLVGKGGMGEVYKAEDLQLSQVVALKFLPEAVVGDEDMLARFRGEVRNGPQVSHIKDAEADCQS